MPIIFPIISFVVFCLYVSLLYLDEYLSKLRQVRIRKIQQSKIIRESKKKPLEFKWPEGIPRHDI